jgi:translation initiation factor IF-2
MEIDNPSARPPLAAVAPPPPPPPPPPTPVPAAVAQSPAAPATEAPAPDTGLGDEVPAALAAALAQYHFKRQRIAELSAEKVLVA